MPRDLTDEWLIADAERQGLTLSEYEKRYGIQITGGPAEHRTQYHELPAGLVTDDDLGHAHHFERRRLEHRPRNGRRQRALRRAA